MHAVAIFILFGNKLFLEVMRVLGTRFEIEFFNFLYDLMGDSTVLRHVGVTLCLNGFKTSISIISKCLALLFLPALDETFDCFKSIALLFLGELAVLAHRVETDNELLLHRAEGAESDLRPFTLFWLKLLARSDGLIALRVLICLPLQAFLILLVTTVLNILPVCDGLSQSLVKEAALVDEGNRHEATKAWHPLVVHARLAHYFLHVNVLEALHETDLADRLLTLFID